MKKLFMSVALFICSLMFIPCVNAATDFTYEGWTAGNGYGSKTEVESYITNLKGETTVNNGMYFGPFNKQSTQKLAEGIVEETHVDLDFETFEVAELFEVSLALNDKDGNRLDEAVVMTQLVEEGKFKLTAGWAPEFEAVVTKDGVYTYQWEVYVENEKAYVKFNLVKNGEVVETTGAIEFTKLNAEGVSVRYLWFCNIRVSEGVNVYRTLPVLTVETDTNSDFITVVDPEKTKSILESTVKNHNEFKYFVERFNSVVVVVPYEATEEDLEDLSDEEIKLFEDAVEDDKIVKYFSNMVGVGDDNVADIIIELNDKIEYNMVLPEGLPAVEKGYERKYYLIELYPTDNKINDFGVNVIEPELLEDGDNLVFATNKSGIYALSYVDSVLPPKTGDISFIGISLITIISLIGGFIAIKSIRKSVSNI